MGERSERQVRQELAEFTRPVHDDPLDDWCVGCGAAPARDCAPDCPTRGPDDCRTVGCPNKADPRAENSGRCLRCSDRLEEARMGNA